MFNCAILTISDKGSQGKREDLSGKLLMEKMQLSGYKVMDYKIIPDEKDQIADHLRAYANQGIHLVLTTGGTGFAKRDVTPEATEQVATKKVPGIAEAMRAFSLKITNRAMLSRATSVICEDTLIINLPGSPKACEEILDYLLDPLKHGLEILTGRDSECARH